MERKSIVERKTKETDISISLSLDGTGKSDIHTGIGFFDHMLEGFARHGFFDLKVNVMGDLEVDGHHTVEDTGIVLGQAIKEALGSKTGIRRYGSFILPINYECEYPSGRIGELDTELIREFFYAISYSAGMNLHIKMLSGLNSHHMAEATFKAFAKALDEAVSRDGRIENVLSTKGSLA